MFGEYILENLTECLHSVYFYGIRANCVSQGVRKKHFCHQSTRGVGYGCGHTSKATKKNLSSIRAKLWLGRHFQIYKGISKIIQRKSWPNLVSAIIFYISYDLMCRFQRCSTFSSQFPQTCDLTYTFGHNISIGYGQNVKNMAENDSNGHTGLVLMAKQIGQVSCLWNL